MRRCAHLLPRRHDHENHTLGVLSLLSMAHRQRATLLPFWKTRAVLIRSRNDDVDDLSLCFVLVPSPSAFLSAESL